MNPIYKFTLSANGGAEQQAFPIYRDDVSKDFELQTGQEFYRAKLSGKLTFVRDDYDFIAAQSFDTEFVVKIYISYDAGQTWMEYWVGNFWKTGCTFNADDKNVTLTPDVLDRYTDVLAGMEKEYNLIDLVPEIVPIKLDKRPMLQIYVPGQSVIGCFLSGMWWEQECQSITNAEDLVNIYKFTWNKKIRVGDISGNMSPQLPDTFTRENPASYLAPMFGGNYGLYVMYDETDPENPFWYWWISDNVNLIKLWEYTSYASISNIPYSITLTPVSGSGATGNVTVYVHDIDVYARYVCDVELTGQYETFPIPDNDLVDNNRNYSRVIGYDSPDSIMFSTWLSQNPTKWGIYQPGQYYVSPADIPSYGINNAFPVARAAWGIVSIWFVQDYFDFVVETRFRKEYTLRDAFPLYSVISVLLNKIAPGLTHQGTTAYSAFLYGVNPISGINQRLFITPKSNVITLGYDQPAQKATITLKRVMDMLRDCFRCYWFVDDQNRFRIEHIQFFQRGGAYTGTPVVGRDLTMEQVTRNGKKLAFCTSEYKFDKPEMAARYQFGWMDDVTEPFDGPAIDIISKYVNPDNIENIDIAMFTSDVDYILLNPSDISKDGFVLLSAELQSGVYKLPYLNIDLNERLQNGFVSFWYLQRYYFHDMPAKYFSINGAQYQALGIKKLKIQTLKFPAYNDPNTLQLIKTDLGNGTIQKMSVNLSSRNANATLKYDTE